MNQEVNIPELVIKSYSTESVVAFLTNKLKKYNTGENQSAELTLYVDILDGLNRKLGGKGGATVL